MVPPLARDALLNPRGFVVGKLELRVEIRDDDSEGGLGGINASNFLANFPLVDAWLDASRKNFN